MTGQESFIQKFNLTDDDIISRASINSEIEQNIVRFQERDGNLIITYVNLYRQVEPLDKDDPTKIDPWNNKTLERKRLSPDQAEIKGRKYDSSPGSKSKFFYCEAIIRKFEQGKKIKILYLVEGEKKAQAGNKYGIDCIGIPGIQMYKDRDTKNLDQGIIDLIIKCKVECIVILHDADALGPQKIKKLNEEGKDLSVRLRQFAAPVKGIRELFKQFENIDIYYAYGSPDFEETAKGIDDLYYLKREDPLQVTNDINKLARSKYFKIVNITDFNNNRINKIFFLDKKGPGFFYSYFISVLKDKNFIFNGSNYIGSNGVPERVIPKDSDVDSFGQNEDLKDINYFIRDGKYFKTVHTNKIEFDMQISNFIMKIEYHFIDGSNNTKRLIKLKRYTGEIHNVEVLSSETARKDAFETILKSHNCTFLGNNYDLAIIFSALMDHQKEAYTITTMGFQPNHNLYALSNVIISDGSLFYFNQIGIAKVNDKSFYIPAWAESNKDNPAFQEDRNFEFRQGNIDFATWSKLIYEAYDLNGSVAILFLINALFRDIVFEAQNFFPFLFLFGPAGVGKSSFTDLFLKLFGKKETGESLKNSTPKGIARKCSQRKNAIVFLKEYDAGLDKPVIKFLKDAYDGAGYTRAQTSNDKRTDTILVESAMFIDGNILPTSESAVFDRMIILNFEKESHTEKETAAFNKLVDEAQWGFGQIIKEILIYQPKFKKEFTNQFREIYNDLKSSKGETYEVDISKLPDRTIKHVALLLTPYYILDELKFPFPLKELLQKILNDAAEKAEMLSELKDVNIFWDAINNEINSPFPRIAKNKQYIRDDGDKILYLKVKDCFPLYMEYCKKNNIQYVDHNSLNSLLTADNYAYIPSNQKDRGKKIYKLHFGNCIKLRFDIISRSETVNGLITSYQTIAIKGKEIYIKE